MHPKKIYTRDVNKKTYFLLKYPTYGDALERESALAEFRSKIQMIQLDLSILEKKISCEIDGVEKIISASADDWEQEVEAVRERIRSYRDQEVEVQLEASEYVDDFRLEWVARHLVGWNYASNLGNPAKDLSDALSVPDSGESLKALALDRRIVDAMIEEVAKLYDGEEEKND